MGISENNRKWLDGIRIHKLTLHELMERQLREMNAQQQFMEENGLSHIDLEKLLTCGCQLVTIENNKITLVDPKRKPVSNAKQYLMHMDLSHDVKYYKQDDDGEIVEQKTIKNETAIDDGNGNPLFKVIDYERGNGRIDEMMKEWINGIKSNNTKVKYDHYNDDDETGFVFPIVSKCEIVGNGPSPFESCAKSIYELIKTRDVVIIQSIFGFGGSDVPFSLFLKNDFGYITAIWLDADWEFYSIKRDDDKHVWRPCWDSYFNDNRKHEDWCLNGGERFCRMMDRVMHEIAKEQHISVDDPSLTPIDFYRYLMRTEPYCEFECASYNFENELCEYLKSEYMFTLEQWLKDNPDRTPEDALGTYEFDEENEEYDCSYYIIYEHSNQSK